MILPVHNLFVTPKNPCYSCLIIKYKFITWELLLANSISRKKIKSKVLNIPICCSEGLQVVGTSCNKNSVQGGVRTTGESSSLRPCIVTINCRQLCGYQVVNSKKYTETAPLLRQCGTLCYASRLDSLGHKTTQIPKSVPNVGDLCLMQVAKENKCHREKKWSSI